MTNFQLNYSRKLFLVVVCLSLIPLLILSAILYLDKIETETEFVENRLNSISETGSESIYEWISERKNNLYAIAQDSVIVSSSKQLSKSSIEKEEYFQSRFELEMELETFLDNFPVFHNFIVTNYKTGEIIFYTDLSPPVQKIKNQEHFLQAVNGEIGVGDVFLSSKALPNEQGDYEKNIPTFFISAPIQGDVGIEGVLTAKVNLFKLEPLRSTNDFQTTDTYMVNSEGYFLSKPKFLDEDEFGFLQNRPELKLQTVSPNSNQLTEIFQMSNGEKTVLQMNGYDNYQGNLVIGAISPIKETNWNYIAEVEKNEAFFGIFIIQMLIIYVISIAGLVIIGTSLHFSSGLSSPIKKLQNAAEQITKGNLDVQTDIDSKDEIGDLSKAFEHMAENLKKMTDIEVQLVLQQNLRKALDESSIVSILDTKGKITFVNDKFCEVSKYSKEEIIGKHQNILRSGIHPRGFYKKLWEKISNGNIWHGEICNKAKDGTLFWNETTIVPFSDKDGRIYEYVAVRNDITQQKNLSKKLVSAERLSAIGELSARISHDIRNPLSVIKNEIELLKLKKQLDKNHTNRMDNAMKRISHQIDEVLEYVRETPLQISRFELSHLVNMALDSIIIPKEVRIRISGNVIFMVGDERKMEVVLVNLIFNAVQAVKNKGVIEIKLSENNKDVEIEVTDSGPGIKIDPIEKVFDALITSKQKGTGLGLASVQNIVKQHGGSIAVKNNPTTFNIKIPKKDWNN